jgi:uncharacterized protein (DUF433 family)
MTTELPRYFESEYEQISHKNNQTEDVRVRQKDEEDYIAVDFETGVTAWGDTKEKALLSLGKNWIIYRQAERSGEIVSTEDTLGGDPRVDGSRIGVEHIVNMSEEVESLAELAASFSGVLSIQEVKNALEWAEKHPETMDEIRRERELFREFIREEWDEGEVENTYTPNEDTPPFEEWREQKNY